MQGGSKEQQRTNQTFMASAVKYQQNHILMVKSNSPASRAKQYVKQAKKVLHISPLKSFGPDSRMTKGTYVRLNTIERQKRHQCVTPIGTSSTSAQRRLAPSGLFENANLQPLLKNQQKQQSIAVEQQPSNNTSISEAKRCGVNNDKQDIRPLSSRLDSTMSHEEAERVMLKSMQLKLEEYPINLPNTSSKDNFNDKQTKTNNYDYQSIQEESSLEQKEDHSRPIAAQQYSPRKKLNLTQLENSGNSPRRRTTVDLAQDDMQKSNLFKLSRINPNNNIATGFKQQTAIDKNKLAARKYSQLTDNNQQKYQNKTILIPKQMNLSLMSRLSPSPPQTAVPQSAFNYRIQQNMSVKTAEPSQRMGRTGRPSAVHQTTKHDNQTNHHNCNQNSNKASFALKQASFQHDLQSSCDAGQSIRQSGANKFTVSLSDDTWIKIGNKSYRLSSLLDQQISAETSNFAEGCLCYGHGSPILVQKAPKQTADDISVGLRQETARQRYNQIAQTSAAVIQRKRQDRNSRTIGAADKDYYQRQFMSKMCGVNSSNSMIQVLGTDSQDNSSPSPNKTKKSSKIVSQYRNHFSANKSHNQSRGSSHYTISDQDSSDQQIRSQSKYRHYKDKKERGNREGQRDIALQISDSKIMPDGNGFNLNEDDEKHSSHRNDLSQYSQNHIMMEHDDEYESEKLSQEADKLQLTTKTSVIKKLSNQKQAQLMQLKQQQQQHSQQNSKTRQALDFIENNQKETNKIKVVDSHKFKEFGIYQTTQSQTNNINVSKKDSCNSEFAHRLDTNIDYASLVCDDQLNTQKLQTIRLGQMSVLVKRDQRSSTQQQTEQNNQTIDNERSLLSTSETNSGREINLTSSGLPPFDKRLGHIFNFNVPLDHSGAAVKITTQLPAPQKTGSMAAETQQYSLQKSSVAEGKKTQNKEKDGKSKEEYASLKVKQFTFGNSHNVEYLYASKDDLQVGAITSHRGNVVNGQVVPKEAPLQNYVGVIPVIEPEQAIHQHQTIKQRRYVNKITISQDDGRVSSNLTQGYGPQSNSINHQNKQENYTYILSPKAAQKPQSTINGSLASQLSQKKSSMNDQSAFLLAESSQSWANQNDSESIEQSQQQFLASFKVNHKRTSVPITNNTAAAASYHQQNNSNRIVKGTMRTHQQRKDSSVDDKNLLRINTFDLDKMKQRSSVTPKVFNRNIQQPISPKAANQNKTVQNFIEVRIAGQHNMFTDQNQQSKTMEPKMISQLKANRYLDRQNMIMDNESHINYLTSASSIQQKGPSVMNGSVIGANDSSRNQASLLQALKVVQQKQNVFSKLNKQRINVREKSYLSPLLTQKFQNLNTQNQLNRKCTTTFSVNDGQMGESQIYNKKTPNAKDDDVAERNRTNAHNGAQINNNLFLQCVISSQGGPLSDQDTLSPRITKSKPQKQKTSPRITTIPTNRYVADCKQYSLDNDEMKMQIQSKFILELSKR